jgi:hypothetical protein
MVETDSAALRTLASANRSDRKALSFDPGALASAFETSPSVAEAKGTVVAALCFVLMAAKPA